jgi:hypothetical protein
LRDIVPAERAFSGGLERELGERFGDAAHFLAEREQFVGLRVR